MSSDQPRRGRDSIGAASAGSPMGSTAAIVIAVVAVVAGFLILRQIRDDDGGTASVPDVSVTTPDTVPASSLTPQSTAPAFTTTTVFVPTVDGATVVVANSSTVDGAAGRLTTALQGQGFTTADATNATAKQEQTTILYDPTDPEALAVAQSLGVLMNVSIIQEVPTPAPVEGGVLPDGAAVIVMLGSDKATLTLEQMSAPTTTVPVASVPAGGTESTTAP